MPIPGDMMSSNISPLMEAILCNQDALAEGLIQSGADLKLQDEHGSTALHYAVLQDNLPLARMLIQASLTVSNILDDLSQSSSPSRRLIDLQDHGAWTPLMWAAEHGRVKMTQLLLASEADVCSFDQEGNMALHWAVTSNSFETVKLICEHCPSEFVNKRNKFGDTPVMLACHKKFAKALEYFLEHGGNSLMKNADNLSCLEICRSLHANDLVELIQAKANSHIITNDISKGKEKFPIPVSNEIDRTSLPIDFVYVSSMCFNVLLDNSDISKKSCCCAGDCLSSVGDCYCLTDTFVLYDSNGFLKHSSQTQNIIGRECSPFCACSARCSNRVAQKGIRYKMSIRRTQGVGWGLFAEEDIPTKAFICEYVGEVVQDRFSFASASSQSDVLNDSVAVPRNDNDDTYLFDLSPSQEDPTVSFCTDARRFGNVSRFMNHSCCPNAMSMKILWDHCDRRFPHLCFFASCGIPKGQEIRIDYGPAFWAVKGHQFECECNSINCKYRGDKLKSILLPIVH